MAIAFKIKNTTYRLMFKYGWFYTNVNYQLADGRRIARDFMANAISNSHENLSGDLMLFDEAGNNGKASKYIWRMCTTFINKVEVGVDGKNISTLIIGPYTSVCVPHDRFSYQEARTHALLTLRDAALREYTRAKRRNQEPHADFFISMDGFVAYGKRKRG